MTHHQPIHRLLYDTGAIDRTGDGPPLLPRRLLLDPAGAAAVASRLHQLLIRHDTHKLAATADGVLIAAQTVLYSLTTANGAGPPIRAYHHRIQLTDHGRLTHTEGHPPRPGEAVAVVTDMITTGESLLHTLRAAEDAGAAVTLAFAAIEQADQGRRLIEATGHPLYTMYRH